MSAGNEEGADLRCASRSAAARPFKASSSQLCGIGGAVVETRRVGVMGVEGLSASTPCWRRGWFPFSVLSRGMVGCAELFVVDLSPASPERA